MNVTFPSHNHEEARSRTLLQYNHLIAIYQANKTLDKSR
jgi:hypothetical protein